MNYYNTISESYSKLHKEEQFNKLRIIKEHLNFMGYLTEKPQILDIGCGPCWSTEFFDNVTGIDPAEKLLHLDKNVIKASAEHLPFPDDSFDIILSVTAIHHFDLNKAILEMKRVARKNARLCISILKKSSKHDHIRTTLIQEFNIKKEISETKDTILIMQFL